MLKPPLAERLRPTSLSQVVGQEHLIGTGKILTQLLERGELANLIFWGPPGVGKTTIARILARELQADFLELSAVMAGKKEVLEAIERARQNWNLQIRTILFVDEIHRFNRAQQDAFLPHVESGLITLIGATTENPSYEIIPPLLSRSKVLVLQPLDKASLSILAQRALELEGRSDDLPIAALQILLDCAGGDARFTLNLLELSLSLVDPGSPLTPEIITQAAGTRLPSYDKHQEAHYSCASALIKSLRGSDVDAALYYFARMATAGEDLKFIARRLVIFASEDIGLAGNGALGLALQAFEAVEKVGAPEAEIVLSHVICALARAPKSRATYDAYQRAKQAAAVSADLPVPLFLRNPHDQTAVNLGIGQGMEWQAGFHADRSYFPEQLPDKLQHFFDYQNSRPIKQPHKRR